MTRIGIYHLLSHPIPAWLAAVPVLVLLLLELVRAWRSSYQPDHHAELLDLHREQIKAHGATVAAFAELAKAGRENEAG